MIGFLALLIFMTEVTKYRGFDGLGFLKPINNFISLDYGSAAGDEFYLYGLSPVISLLRVT